MPIQNYNLLGNEGLAAPVQDDSGYEKLKAEFPSYAKEIDEGKAAQRPLDALREDLAGTHLVDVMRGGLLPEEVSQQISTAMVNGSPVLPILDALRNSGAVNAKPQTMLEQEFERVVGPVPYATPKKRELFGEQTILSNLAQGFKDINRETGVVIKAAGKFLPGEAVENYGENWIKDAEKDILKSEQYTRDLANPNFDAEHGPGDIAFWDRAVLNAARSAPLSIAQMLPQAAVAAFKMTPGVGLAVTTAGVVWNALQMGGDTAIQIEDELRKQGLTPEDIRRAADWQTVATTGIPAAAAEYLGNLVEIKALSHAPPISDFLKPKGTRNLLRAGRVAGAAASSAAGEGLLEETSQQLINNLGVKFYAKPDQDVWEGVPQAAAAGAIMGGAMGAAGRTVRETPMFLGDLLASRTTKAQAKAAEEAAKAAGVEPAKAGSTPKATNEVPPALESDATKAEAPASPGEAGTTETVDQTATSAKTSPKEAPNPQEFLTSAGTRIVAPTLEQANQLAQDQLGETAHQAVKDQGKAVVMILDSKTNLARPVIVPAAMVQTYRENKDAFTEAMQPRLARMPLSKVLKVDPTGFVLPGKPAVGPVANMSLSDYIASNPKADKIAPGDTDFPAPTVSIFEGKKPATTDFTPQQADELISISKPEIRGGKDAGSMTQLEKKQAVENIVTLGPSAIQPGAVARVRHYAAVKDAIAKGTLTPQDAVKLGFRETYPQIKRDFTNIDFDAIKGPEVKVPTVTREDVGAAGAKTAPKPKTEGAATPSSAPAGGKPMPKSTWEHGYDLAIRAEAEGVDLAALSREQYADFAVSHGAKIDDDQLRMLPKLRSAKSLEEMSKMRQELRPITQEQKDADAAFSAWSAQVGQMALERKSDKTKGILAPGVAVRSGTHDSDSWNYFGINSGANSSDPTVHKAYAGFSDIYKSLTPARIIAFMVELQKRGFNGDLKTVQDLQGQRAISDQIVMHGKTENDAKIAHDAAKEFFGTELNFLDRGKDISGKSHSQVLAERIKNGERSATALTDEEMTKLEDDFETEQRLAREAKAHADEVARMQAEAMFTPAPAEAAAPEAPKAPAAPAPKAPESKKLKTKAPAAPAPVEESPAGAFAPVLEQMRSTAAARGEQTATFPLEVTGETVPNTDTWKTVPYGVKKLDKKTWATWIPAIDKPGDKPRLSGTKADAVEKAQWVIDDAIKTGKIAPSKKLKSRGTKADLPSENPRPATRLKRIQTETNQIMASPATARDEWEAAERAKAEADALLAQIEAKREKNREARSKGRMRGADHVIRQILSAKIDGRIDGATADLGVWLLMKNPSLADELAISIRRPFLDENGEPKATLGEYSPVGRLIRIFTVPGHTGTTVVHEVSHHAERLMPEESRKPIEKLWMAEVVKSFKTGSPERNAALMSVITNPDHETETFLNAVKSGLLTKERDYALSSPSEFWAANSSRLIQERKGEKWLDTAVRFMRELLAKIKDLLGFDSMHPVYKAVNDMLDGKWGDGFLESGNRMLQTPAEKAAASSASAFDAQKNKTLQSRGRRNPNAFLKKEWTRPNGPMAQQEWLNKQDNPPEPEAPETQTAPIPAPSAPMSPPPPPVFEKLKRPTPPGSQLRMFDPINPVEARGPAATVPIQGNLGAVQAVVANFQKSFGPLHGAVFAPAGSAPDANTKGEINTETGKVTIFLENIASPEELFAVIGHEDLAHKVLPLMLGDTWANVLEAADKSKHPAWVAARAFVRENYGRLTPEEVVAAWVTNQLWTNPKPSGLSLFGRTLAAIKNFMYRTFTGAKEKLKDAEMLAQLKTAMDGAQAWKLANPDAYANPAAYGLNNEAATLAARGRPLVEYPTVWTDAMMAQIQKLLPGTKHIRPGVKTELTPAQLAAMSPEERNLHNMLESPDVRDLGKVAGYFFTPWHLAKKFAPVKAFVETMIAKQHKFVQTIYTFQQLASRYSSATKEQRADADALLAYGDEMNQTFVNDKKAAEGAFATALSRKNQTPRVLSQEAFEAYKAYRNVLDTIQAELVAKTQAKVDELENQKQLRSQVLADMALKTRPSITLQQLQDLQKADATYVRLDELHTAEFNALEAMKSVVGYIPRMRDEGWHITYNDPTTGEPFRRVFSGEMADTPVVGQTFSLKAKEDAEAFGKTLIAQGMKPLTREQYNSMVVDNQIAVKNGYPKPHPDLDFNHYFVIDESKPTPEEAFRNTSRFGVSKMLETVLVRSDKKDVKAAKDLSEAIYFGRGFRQHLLHRQSAVYENGVRVNRVIKGYQTEDLGEVLSNYIAGYSAVQSKEGAALEFSRILGDLMKSKQNNLFSYLDQYIADDMKMNSGWDKAANMVSGMNFMFNMSFRVSTAAINLTQNYLFGAHQLALKARELNLKGWHEGRSYKEMLSANETAARFLVAKGVDGQKTINWQKLSVQEQEEFMMLEYMLETSNLHSLVNEDLKTLAQSHSTTVRAYSKVAEVGSWMFQKTEVLNRLTAFLAAYRMYKSMPGRTDLENRHDAEMFSLDVNYPYEKWNQPIIFKGGEYMRVAQPIVFGLQSFISNAWQMLVMLDARAAGGIALTYMIMAGVPFQDILKWLYRQIREGRDMTKDIAAEYGQTTANIFREGLVPTIASGVFGAMPSLSQSLSMGPPPVVGLALTLAGVQKQTSGPFQSWMGNLVQVAQGQEDWTNIMPQAARGIYQAFDESTGGIKTASGMRFMADGEAVKTTGAEGVMRFLGFNPMRRAQFKADIYDQNKTTARLNEMRRQLVDKYIDEPSDETEQAINDFNAMRAELRTAYGNYIVTGPITAKTIANRRKGTKVADILWEQQQ